MEPVGKTAISVEKLPSYASTEKNDINRVVNNDVNLGFNYKICVLCLVQYCLRLGLKAETLSLENYLSSFLVSYDMLFKGLLVVITNFILAVSVTSHVIPTVM